uniref:Minichromosome loss protein Mcl1 middle region domain-containing protein n=1 Tax=Globodera rostochiensis TaxID=31243 RepID=A0A914HMR0_GLORO
MVVTRSKHIHAPGILSLATDQSGNDAETVFCCSSDETFGLWTCGMDGSLDVDIRNTASNCRGVLAVFGEDIYVAEHGQDVITGNDQHVVVKYGLAAFLSSSPLLMFSLELTALACNGTHLIAGSSDFIVKCCKLESDGELSIDRYECDAVIVNISISPDGAYFALSTADGYVEVRPVVKPTGSAGKRPLVRQRVVNQQFSDPKPDCPRMQCCWDCDGGGSTDAADNRRQQRLFIAGKGGVFVLSTDSWEQQTLLTHADLAYDTFSVLAIRPTPVGHSLLAAATLRGALALWRLSADGHQSADELLSIRTQIASDLGTITSLLFRPRPAGRSEEDTVLLAACSEGYICSVTDVALPDPRFCTPSSSRMVASSFVDDQTAEELTRSESVVDIDDGGGAANSVVAEDEEMETDLGLIKSQFGFDQFGQFVGQSSAGDSSGSRRVGAGMRPPKSFAIGATPAVGEAADRYLTWNSYGVIKSFKSNDDSTIEVLFHDATVHSELMIDNNVPNYVLGDLNTDLVALASKSNANKESELYVQHISAWGEHSSRVWSQPMLPEERIEFLCVGRNFVAVATDARHLRVFTAGGTQRFIVSLATSPLTMTARGDKLAIASSTGGVLVDSEDDYEHRASATVYTVNALSGECAPSLDWTCAIPLSPFSRLCWLNFTPCGNLVAMDEECTVRLHLSGPNAGGGVGLWLPVLCGAELLRDPETDFLWPIALQEVPQHQFRHIYCRNAKFPAFGSKSVPETVPWTMPMLNQESERGKLEAELMVNEVQQMVVRRGNNDNLALDAEQTRQIAQLTQNYMSNLLKLFSVSCQLNREGRATEIVHRTTNPKVIQAMCNYAAKAQRPALSEKIASIGREHLRTVEAEQQRKKLQQLQSTSAASGNASFCRRVEEGAQDEAGRTAAGDDEIVLMNPNVNKMLLPKRKATASALLDSLRIGTGVKKQKPSAKVQSSVSSSSITNPTFIDEVDLTMTENDNDENAVADKDHNISPNEQQQDVINSSSIGGDGGVAAVGCSNTTMNNSSMLSSLSDSMLLDASPMNNPFKKKAPQKTPDIAAGKLGKSVTAVGGPSFHRGFLEQPRDNVAEFTDFFDTLQSASTASSAAERRKK